VRRSPALIAAAVVAMLGVAAAVALAVTVRDRDDTKIGVDIAKATGSHNRATDELVHTIDGYEPFGPSDMVSRDRPPSSVCVEIWTTNEPGERGANYEACATGDARGRNWKGALSRARRKGHPLRVATLKVEQPADTRLVIRIDPDDIRRPDSYRWRAETTSFGKDCKSSQGCPDYAPDRPDTAETRLGKPR
jgi:hypothetical protein